MVGSVPEARTARYAPIRASDTDILDRGLVIYFPAPASFTGEDCAEFHLHGGRAVVDAVLRQLSRFSDTRAAEAGEFTRRAFLNGKIDLTEAEGLSDLIAAETEMQRRFALSNASGDQKTLYGNWRERLLKMRALIEAELDFSDEEDVPGAVSDAVWRDAAVLADELARHIGTYDRGEIVRDGFRIVLLGAPNAGKSSLLNALACRDAAIVTDEPGTTRDPVEVLLDLGGFQVNLIDTAGIRETDGTVEKLGIERSRARAGDAHLVLLLEDLADPVSIDLNYGDKPVLCIGTKSDLAGDRPGYDFCISVKTGAGIDTLLTELGAMVSERIGEVGSALPSRRRHVDLLQEAADRIGAAAGMSEHPLELRAEELRLAADALGRISGAIDVEDLLDVIFSRFCIGK